MLWFSKIIGYEQPCNVTGIGNIQVQSKHLKVYIKIKISKHGKLAMWRKLYSIETFVTKNNKHIYASESGGTVPMKP